MNNELDVFLTAEKTQIFSELTSPLENVLDEHYQLFKKKLFLGFAIAGTGIVLLILNLSLTSLVPHVLIPVLSTLSLSLTACGIAIIAYPFIKKRRIRILDYAIYPIVGVPYPLGTRAVLIDVLGYIGDDVTLDVAQLKMVSHELRESQIAAEKSLSVLRFDEESEKLASTLGKNGLTWSFEDEIKRSLEKLLEQVTNVPINQVSLRLLEPAGDVNLAKSTVPEVKLLVEGRLPSDLVKTAIDLTQAHFENLEDRFKRELENARDTVRRVVEFMNSWFYKEVEKSLIATLSTIEALLSNQYIPVCSKCLISGRGYATYNSDVPRMLATYTMEQYVIGKYSCSRCGNAVVESFDPAIPTHERALKPLVRMHRLELIQSIAWSEFYRLNKEIIDSYIRKTRELKDQEFTKASSFAEKRLRELRLILLQMYSRLTRQVAIARSSSKVLEKATAVLGPGEIPCEGTATFHDLEAVLEKTLDLIGTGEQVEKYTRMLHEARKLKTNKLFNEIIVRKIAEAHMTLGDQERARRILELYEKMEFDELRSILNGVTQ